MRKIGWLRKGIGIVLALWLGSVQAFGQEARPRPTEPARERPTQTSVPTETATPTDMPTPTETVRPTNTPTPTRYPTYTPLPTYTPYPTMTPSLSETPVPIRETVMPHPTIGLPPIIFPTRQPRQPTATLNWSATETARPTATGWPTRRPSPTATMRPTVTPNWSATERARPTVTPWPTRPPSPTASSSSTATPNGSATKTARPTATRWPTEPPSPTATATPLPPTATSDWPATKAYKREVWIVQATGTMTAQLTETETVTPTLTPSPVHAVVVPIVQPAPTVPAATAEPPGVVRIEVYIDHDQDGVLDPAEGISGLVITAETSRQTWSGSGETTNGVAILRVPLNETVYIAVPYLQQSERTMATHETDGTVAVGIVPSLLPIALP